MIRRGFAMVTGTLWAALVPTATAAPPPVGIDYPDVRRSDQVDQYFGVTVADPYRWMERLDDPEVAAFVEARHLEME